MEFGVPCLGDADDFDITIDIGENILGRGYAYHGLELTGIFFIDFNHPRTLDVASAGFRASRPW